MQKRLEAVIATLSVSKSRGKGSEVTSGVTCECVHVCAHSLGVANSGDSHQWLYETHTLASRIICRKPHSQQA